MQCWESVRTGWEADRLYLDYVGKHASTVLAWRGHVQR